MKQGRKGEAGGRVKQGREGEAGGRVKQGREGEDLVERYIGCNLFNDWHLFC